MRANAQDRQPEVTHQHVLDEALCHAALLLQRAAWFSRHLALVPDPGEDFGGASPGLLAADADVDAIFAGFERVGECPATQRGALLPDTFSERVAESSRRLDALLTSDGARGLGLTELLRRVRLGDDQRDALLVVLAGELDPRFGRLFGFLRNDALVARPTVGVLQLAVSPRFAGMALHDVLGAGCPLVRQGLIAIDADPSVPATVWPVRVPDHVVQLLVRPLPDLAPGRDGGRPWVALRWPTAEKGPLRATLGRHLDGATAGRVMIVEGPPSCGRRAAVRAACVAADRALVMCELSRGASISEASLLAKVSGAALVVHSDGALSKDKAALAELATLGHEDDVPVFVTCRPDETETLAAELRFVRATIPKLAPAGRRSVWIDVIGEQALDVSRETLDQLSSRYQLSPGRIHEVGRELARCRAGAASPVAVADVRDVLRDLTTEAIRQHAQLYEAALDLDQLVLAPQVRERLEDLVRRVQHGFQVIEEWGFSRGGSSRSRGASAIFSGPSGTGKTATAGAIARALDVDLYTVDLSQIMSKWVGETERNLAKLFDEAEASNAALLFDEADSLFAKRSSDVKGANDRYANLTVNYLLQRIEQYDGLAILTTNLPEAIDDAFQRRVTVHVRFDAPDLDERVALYRCLLPSRCSYAEDVALDEIAEEFRFTGAHIRNALMRAAFSIADSRGARPVLTHDALRMAAVREAEDLGWAVRRETAEPGHSRRRAA